MHLYTLTRYGTCDIVCELILSFRSLATVLVFYFTKRNRDELCDVRTSCRLLIARLAACCGSRLPYQRMSDSALDAISAGTDPDNEAQWRIQESDLQLDKTLATGAYGVVWSGEWRGQAVAVKMLKFGAVDSDGDPTDPEALLDFQQECAMLQRLHHPHLLRFHGYGTAAVGSGFIVTELMSMGSLFAVLGDAAIDLPWATRTSVALQLSLGMDHLHNHPTPIVHRDLKSPNVLLGQDFHCKVADFGSSRLFRPKPPAVLISAFTGATWSAPLTADCAMVGLGVRSGLATMPSLAVGVVDASGTMTHAVGTLLWMPPEMLRGDRHYSAAVDVYAFGIVLWEIATRDTPWSELGTTLRFPELIAIITGALQTGRRPAIPESVVTAQPEFAALIESCWQGDPARRPSFASIISMLTHRCGASVPSHLSLDTTPARMACTETPFTPTSRLVGDALTQPLLQD